MWVVEVSEVFELALNADEKTMLTSGEISNEKFKNIDDG